MSWLLSRARLVLASAVFLSILGALAWMLMPRQEDPSMPATFGLVVVPYPGADAEKVERLVLDPVEEALAGVEDIKKLKSTVRAEVAIVNVELRDGTKDVDRAWDEVRAALAEARAEMPPGVGEATVDDEINRTESVVFALTGSADRLELAEGAERLKRALLSLPEVSKVELIADPGEQITIAYDDAVARRYGLDARALGAQIEARSGALPGGTIKIGSRSATLRPNSELESLEEIAATPMLLPGGATVPLSQLATVRRTAEEPEGSYMRVDGRPAVGVGVVPHQGVNVVAFGRAVRDEAARVAPTLAPLEMEELVFQPQRVEDRLSDLGRSLLVGIGIVAGLLIALMGVRLGLLVASVVPLVAAVSLAAFAMGGGMLHQISIAALVLALGMLVDNAIVVAEGVQRRLDEGQTAAEATSTTVRELWLPLASATGTTLAAFVPMLLSEGPTAEFTRSIPVVLMLSLTVSYLFAVLVTPLLAAVVLEPRRAPGGPAGVAGVARRRLDFDRVASAVGRFAVRRRSLVLGGAALLVALSALGLGSVEQRFFPSSDRNQAVVSLELAEGTHIFETDDVAQQVEAALAQHPQVQGVATFVGRATPKFYYNLLTRPQSPHLAQILVETKSVAAVEEVLEWTRAHVRDHHPDVEIVARGLEQGPPVAAPIELRLVGDDLGDLAAAAEQVVQVVRQTDGTRDVRHNLGVGVPTLRFDVDDAVAARHGLSRRDVALSLLGRTRGVVVGELRQGDDPVPIRVRASAGELMPANALAAVDVAEPGRAPVPLAQVARERVEWQAATVHHHQRRRAVSVLAELPGDVPFSRVLEDLSPRLDALALPAGVRLEIGGAQEGAGQANQALFGALPIGMFLLLFILLAEFNSFRRLLLVMVTVPLAATGVVPGLLVGGQPFGFMSMLGIFALVGIVVNNAIVLLDLTERLRAEGAPIADALAEAVRLRTRPILLTSVTTVAGLLPLALSPTTLWPPLAWAMISGLVASTALTLLVVPAMYSFLFRDPQPATSEQEPSLDSTAAAGA